MTDQTTPSRRAGLHDEIVKALGRIKTIPPVAHRQEQADHVLTVLYREWPWLRAEAEDAAPAGQAPATDQAAVLREAADALDAYIARYRSPSIANWTGAVAFLRRMAVEAQQPSLAVEDCTCIPFTRQGGTPRYCQPGDTVDMISGWEIGGDCPHHRDAVQAQQPKETRS